MSEVLDWVLSHLYVVIVIGFALLSMFGKKSKTSGTGRTRMPTFGGDPGQTDWKPNPLEWQRKDQPAKEHTSQPGTEAAHETSAAPTVQDGGGGSSVPAYSDSTWLENEENSLGQRADEDKEGYEAAEIISLQRKLEQLERKNRSLIQELKRKDAAHPRHAARASSKLEDGKSPLAEGIIWSEILGPPRAKKPYMYKK